MVNIYSSVHDRDGDDTVLCHACSGSGEGMYDGSRCTACNGTGDHYYLIDKAAQKEIDADYAMDRERDNI